MTSDLLRPMGDEDGGWERARHAAPVSGCQDEARLDFRESRPSRRK
jgi:hypothetical protein